MAPIAGMVSGIVKPLACIALASDISPGPLTLAILLSLHIGPGPLNTWVTSTLVRSLTTVSVKFPRTESIKTPEIE